METVLENINIDEEIQKRLARLKGFYSDFTDKYLLLLGLIQLHTHTIDAYLPCSLDEIVKRSLAEAET